MHNKLYDKIDTPALIIQADIAKQNIIDVQEMTNAKGITLRPHIKTHRMTYYAKMQVEHGAKGIACAKIGEAEVMAAAGIDDIFIANEVVGKQKYERILALHRKIKKMRVGIDNTIQVDQIEEVFADEAKPLEVLIEYEVGENRSGIITDEQLHDLVKYCQSKKHIVIKGVFSHEGHTYKADDHKDCIAKAHEAYEKTLQATEKMRAWGVDVDTVSVGATPSVMKGAFVDGITEYRIGTYIFFDVGQSEALGDYSRCAATVLATVISKPNDERVVIDAGAKALVSQNRSGGICSTKGFGRVKGVGDVRIDSLFDEHGIILDKEFSKQINVGDKIEVIPSHICPTVNLYDEAYLVENDEIVSTIPIDCRGKSQ